MNTLTATPRVASGSSAATDARAAGLVPAVVYGPKQETISFSVPILEIEAYLRAHGASGLVTLEGLEKPIQALVHEVDRDPVTHKPRHLDFYAVEKGAKVTVSVQLAFVGESAAVKAGANLVKVLHEVEIEAAPDKIPAELEVAIDALAAEGDKIHVADLTAPAGVAILTDGEEVVALAQAQAEEEPEEAAAIDMGAIEVEQKGKAEGEEEAA